MAGDTAIGSRLRTVYCFLHYVLLPYGACSLFSVFLNLVFLIILMREQPTARAECCGKRSGERQSLHSFMMPTARIMRPVRKR